ncbi:MAG: restriction endonuclease [Armatimonadetes bacterium]|nr:restriction endonuclease [Anaerolineae bacterium]
MPIPPHIPPYTSLMLPLLQLCADGAEHRLSQLTEALADYLGLTEAERAILTPSGKQLKFTYRAYYAATSLRKAGLLANTRRGTLHLTALGARVLASAPLTIDRAFLMQFPAYVEFATRAAPEPSVDGEPTDYLASDHTPKELMHILYTGLHKELADDLLETVLASSPAFFERLVIDLLVAMGYGGKRANAARQLGRSGDGGVDGVIQEDKLGLSVVYIQAKRYARQNVVGRPLVQAFIGSLIGQGAQRGVLLTTSRFSKEAVDYARAMQQHTVILIDGAQLTQLMIEHNVGVQPEETYTLKKLDRGYFDSD